MIQIPVFLYAETHFRFFKFFPSLLYKREPEILFDMPRKCGKNKDLPVMLILNDIKDFPVELKQVSIAISYKGQKPVCFQFDEPNLNSLKHPLGNNSAVFLFFIPRSKLPDGTVHVNCKAMLNHHKKQLVILNDNLIGTSKLGFLCNITSNALPLEESVSYGDIHIHSHYSQSPVEFGTPLRVIDEMANSCGIDFYAVTDHSYDLSCQLDNYLKTDQELTRWKSYLSEVEEIKQSGKRIILSGEEISCYNSKGKTVHLCAVDSENFIEGSSDGARKNSLKTLPLQDVAQKLCDKNSLAIAAHPGSKSGFLQRFFLNRGYWSNADITNNLHALQAVNSGFNKSWDRSKALWIKELLNGNRIPIVGGNDSHGDFNRYRYISMPFLSIAENFDRYLASCKTGLYVKIKNKDDVKRAIIEGKTFVTNGPFVGLSTTDSIVDSIIHKYDVSGGIKSLTAIIESSYEFGTPFLLTVFLGIVGEKKEKVLLEKTFKEQVYSQIVRFELPHLEGKGYVRAEVSCRMKDGKVSFGATSGGFWG